MRPRRDKFWLPLARLSAVFVAVVVGGNVLLHALQPSAESPDPVRRETDFYTRQKRKLDLRLRMIERLFERASSVAPAPAPPVPAEAQPPAPVQAAAEPAKEAAPLPMAVRPEAESQPLVLADPEAVPATLPARMEFDTAGFAWPQPPALPETREVDVEAPSLEMMSLEARGAMYREWRRQAGSSLIMDAGDEILEVPELVIDGILSLGSRLFPRSGSYDWQEGQSEGITARILDLEISPRRGRIFSDFIGHWVEREQRFFSRFEDSYINTYGFEDGTEAVDMGDLGDEHRKVFWDALRKTYLSKYKFRPDEKIRDEAFYFKEWRGVDFLLLPPLLTGYLYYRGYDKKISIGGTVLRLALEPLQDWMKDDEDLVMGLSAEWMIKDFPVGLIVSAGMDDGNIGLDFVGIGTSTGIAKKAMKLNLED